MNKLQKELTEFMKKQEQYLNDIVAIMPTTKQKGCMGSNNVILDYDKATYKEAVDVSNGLDKDMVRVNLFPTKCRILLRIVNNFSRKS